MSEFEWRGVMPFLTTPFSPDGGIDHEMMARHAGWLVNSGCSALVPVSPLGEGALLTPGEKLALLEHLVAAVGHRAPIVPAIDAAATRDAIGLARAAIERGCEAVLLLPPAGHRGPWNEVREHLAAVADAIDVPCAVADDPLHCSPGLSEEQLAEVCNRHPHMEIFADGQGNRSRTRVVAEMLDGRCALACANDAHAAHALREGATVWISALANAFPAECVEMHARLQEGDAHGAALAEWLQPLLYHMQTAVAVQALKLLQSEMGWGNDRVRRPRLSLGGSERDELLSVLRCVMSARPRAETA